MRLGKTRPGVLTLAVRVSIPPRELARSVRASSLSPITYLDSTDVSVARAIAREIRAAALGSKGVKALGLTAHGRAQLSMSITDFKATPISEVYKAVSKLAARHKTGPAEGEVIGLIPEAACERESEWMRQLTEFDPMAKILENRLASPMAWPDKS